MNDLRQQAINALSSYMKHELFDVGGAGAKMYPYIETQAISLIESMDRAKQHVEIMDR